jgi:hypothetical protein
VGNKVYNQQMNTETGNLEESDLDSSIDKILLALGTLRIGISSDEFQIQSMVEQALLDQQISFEKEYQLAPRNRIDFFVDGGIGVEVKRGKPNKTQVTKQLQRYASFEEIKAIVLVVDRTVAIPNEINAKKCILFGLNRLWGVALS